MQKRIKLYIVKEGNSSKVRADNTNRGEVEGKEIIEELIKALRKKKNSKS